MAFAPFAASRSAPAISRRIIGQQFASKDGVADLVDFGQGFLKLARNIREFILWVWHKVAEARLKHHRPTDGIHGNPDGHSTAVLAQKGTLASKLYHSHLEQADRSQGRKALKLERFCWGWILALQLHLDTG